MPRLEDLVVAADPNTAEILSTVVLLGWADGCLDGVEYRAQGNGVIEEVAQQFDDATQRAVANQHEAEDQLTQPLLGDGEVEQHLVVGRLGSERIVERAVGNRALLVDELAADIECVGQLGDGFCLG